MTLYEWKTWAGGKDSIEADAVSFEPEHVAFWRGHLDDWELLRAVQNHNVINLHPAPRDEP